MQVIELSQALCFGHRKVELLLLVLHMLVYFLNCVLAMYLKQFSSLISFCITLFLHSHLIKIGNVFEAFPSAIKFLFVEHADEG